MQAKNWLGDQRIRFKVDASPWAGRQDTKVCVVTRRYKKANGQSGQYAWLHFENGVFYGTIDSKTRLRKLAHAILRAIGDE